MTDKNAGPDVAQLKASAETALEAERAHARLREQAVPYSNVELFYEVGDLNAKKLEAIAAFRAASEPSTILALLDRLETLTAERDSARAAALDEAMDACQRVGIKLDAHYEKFGYGVSLGNIEANGALMCRAALEDLAVPGLEADDVQQPIQGETTAAKGKAK